MKTVSNTTPIISLSSVGKVELLRDLFDEVIIPQAVYDEIKAKKSYGFYEVDFSFFNIQAIRNQNHELLLSNKLDLGEAQTIILAQEVIAKNVIIDENLGYKLAKNYDLNVIRTLSILLKSKELGFIKEVKPLLDEMIKKGRWYSNHVYYSFLKRVGEID